MGWQLAQINIGRIRAPLDSPVMSDFVALLPIINGLAESTPGFVWRLVGDGADATGLRPYEDPLIIVNMSVWESLDALRDYAYRSNHVHAFRRRKEWFEESDAAAFALWWIPSGTRPSVAEGKARLEVLRQHGPAPEAFTFKASFPTPG
jgi:heme-degrading monooxygenase HmoA